MQRIKTGRAIIVEGKDDVSAVSQASEDLIIPTHGFGIRPSVWDLIDTAHRELGLIILTDPDHAGEEIRRRITERYPDSVQCRMARPDAERDGDIGIENAAPEAIRDALTRAMELHSKAAGITSRTGGEAGSSGEEIGMADLAELGLTGCEDASELRQAVSRELGIGYCNARAMVRRLRGFGIGRDELAETVSRIRNLSRGSGRRTNEEQE